jgi:ectoine hydroxylase-related dioxygenase (phytanoyl-CoA dioxygenase family)
MTVTPEQREQFACDGYLEFDLELDHAILDSIIAELADKYGDTGPAINVAYRDGNRIQDAWRINENVKRVARAPKSLALLRHLFGREPLPFQTLNFPKGTEQSAHADAVHFNSMPAKFMCGIWVALEDTDMDNGPLLYYPGSHKFPEADIDAICEKKSDARNILRRLLRRPVMDEDRNAAYQRFVAELIAREHLQPRFATIKKGQAVLWASNLLHGGAIQRDKERSRHSQVTHYFFEGCKYYTPILSTRDQITWRDPHWIID